MTIMGNHCGPRAVAEHERQASHDFIFSSGVNGATPHHLTPKDRTSRAAQPGVPFGAPATRLSCAAETFAPTARSATTQRAATVGEHPASPRPTPAAAHTSPDAAAGSPSDRCWYAMIAGDCPAFVRCPTCPQEGTIT